MGSLSKIFCLLLAGTKTPLEAVLNRVFKHRESRKSVLSINKQLPPMLRTETHGLALPCYHFSLSP